MMKPRASILFSFLAASLLLGAGPETVGGLGVNVSPAKLEFSMAPGKSYTFPITVQSTDPVPTHIQASLADFTITPQGNLKFEPVGGSRYDLMRWVTLNPREFDLPSHTTEQVRLSIALPNKPLSGEYAGIVFFTTRPTRQQHGVAFAVRIASKFYLTIPGTVKLDGAITKMATSQIGGHQVYRVLFKNTGNVHLYTRGQVDVQRPDGQVVDQIALPQNQLVERGDELLFQVSGKSLPAGKYQAIATVDYGGKTMTGGEIAFTTR